MDKKTIGILAGTVLTFAIAGTVLVTKNNTAVTSVVAPSEQALPAPLTEAEAAGTAIKLASGKLMHVFGIYNDKKARVINSVHGKTVVLDTIVSDVTCNILLDAKTAPAAQAKIVKVVNGKLVTVSVAKPELPNVSKLASVFGVVSWPTKIPGSCTKEGKCLWEVLLRGIACKVAGEDPSFVSSSPKEFMTLPSEIRDRAKMLASWFDDKE